MVGKIAFEEAFNLPEWAAMSAYQASLFTPDGDGNAHAARLVDINKTRLEKMDKFGIDYMILSLTAPGIQDFADVAEAEANATLSNDWVADQMKENPTRFGALAALSMHNPEQAAKELTRCVKELGFHGALVNAEQRSGPGGNTPIFYDGPEWDVFWATCVELDVPFYLHPIAPKGTQFDTYWKARSCLVGPCMSFANGVAAHLLGLIVNGVFDRHPKLKVIVGHMGEKIPIDLWRINHWLEDVHKPRGSTKMQRKLREYFADNIYLTTSGDFDTKVLKYVISEVGVDRMMFCLDYPYEAFELGCPWFDGIKPDSDLTQEDLNSIGRNKAIDVFKLKLSKA
ncbi:amidohydrolase 2 [Meredithblackwellia eburnea MCA 4105]